jgi:hypothetical protein
MVAQGLVVFSAAIAIFLGSVHVAYTFFGSQLEPRDPMLQARMNEVPMVLSRDTTVWKAWIGFNASHSAGLILFGTAFAYLALAQPAVLFESKVLVVLGGMFLLAHVLLAKAYWFNVPFAGVVLALVSYVAGIAVAWSVTIR